MIQKYKHLKKLLHRNKIKRIKMPTNVSMLIKECIRKDIAKLAILHNIIPIKENLLIKPKKNSFSNKNKLKDKNQSQVLILSEKVNLKKGLNNKRIKLKHKKQLNYLIKVMNLKSQFQKEPKSIQNEGKIFI